MKRQLLLLGLLMVSAAAPFAPAEARPKENPAVNSGNQFAVDLYDRLRDRPGNLFFSPSSISTALGMVYAGAGGETASQIARVLHTDLTAEKLAAQYAQLLRAQNEGGTERDFQLSVANAFWGQSGYAFLP